MKIKEVLKKRIKILWVILICIILLVMCAFSYQAEAGTNDSTLVREKIDGIYAVAPLSDRVHLYNFEMYKVNNKYSYCIEIGKKVTTDIYNSTMTESEQSNITNISAEKLNYIKLISYFGYGYKNHTDNKYYMAAQELIWEYLNNIDITWTTELNVNGPKIDIEAYKNEIIRLINKYNQPLTFTKVRTKVEEQLNYNYPDGRLEFYKVKSSGKQNAVISPSELKINISNDYTGGDKIIFEKEKYYDTKPILYYFDNSQALLSPGYFDNSDVVLDLYINGEELNTIQIDKDTMTNVPSGQATLIGAVYRLYDEKNNYINSIQTNETGKNKFSNLYHKKYYLIQDKNSKGYKSNKTRYQIDLSSTNNSMTLVEEVIKSNIEINKLYEVDDTLKREPGIIFNIYDNNNNLFTSVKTTETGPDKVVLPYGKYTIKQENTTYGYDKVKDIKLSVDEESNIEIKYDLINKQLKSLLHITTLNKNTNKNIEEANIKYRIKNKKTKKYLTYKDESGKTTSYFYTDSKGEILLPFQVGYGEYSLEQITTPKNYLENEKTKDFTINENTTYSYLDDKVVVNVDFYNQPIIGRIKILTQEELLDKKNGIYSKKTDIRKNVKLSIQDTDKLIKNSTTNSKGSLTLDNLKLGTYCIKDNEINEEQCTNLTPKDNKKEIVEGSVVFIKKLKTSNVSIINKDDDNNKIKGTIIEVSKNNKNSEKKETDENGEITIKDLDIGTYCFKETSISSKYILNDNKICFDVLGDGKDKKFEIINQLKSDNEKSNAGIKKLNINKIIKVPNTLSNKSISFIPLIIGGVIMGGIIYNKKKKNNNN